MRFGTAIAAACLFLAGCGATGTVPAAPDPGVPTTVSKRFNKTDVMFLQMMAQHHWQGVRMARLAAQRAADPQVRTLAAAIDVTQTSEIKTIGHWLRTWRRPPKAAAHEHASHGGSVETSEREIKALAATTGPGFQRRFLDLMIAHQDDAVQLARMELAGGTNTQTRDLAKRIDQSRSAQVTQMLKFLNSRQ